MKAKVIAVIGSKKSGKTTTIENLIRELIKRGYKVGAIKHIPEPNFTIDTKGKDTWRFACSGANTIVSVSSTEIATIEKLNPEDFTLEKVLEKCEGNDIVIIEGLRSLVNQREDIPKIAVVKSKTEVWETLESLKPIIAFTGLYSTEKTCLKIPYVDVLKKSEKIVDIIEEYFGKKHS